MDQLIALHPVQEHRIRESQGCDFAELVRSLLDGGIPSEPQIEHWLDRIEKTP